MDERARRRTCTKKIVYAEAEDDEIPDGRKAPKRRRTSGKPRTTPKPRRSCSSSLTSLDDSQGVRSSQGRSRPAITDPAGLPHRQLGGSLHGPRSHPPSYHFSHLHHVDISASLLDWFDKVKQNRQMPWRKDVSDILAWTVQQKGQRAYEVWVSEIMLQQTQVETVKSYYLRWMTRFPTIFDLSKANVEQVNEYWQGLGYYSRASRLLSGAKKVVEKFDGILPEDPALMEKEVDGIGPYSAGAIASIAYTRPVPMVDGNVHRVLTRLAALYAPQAATATTKFLWSLAADLVPQHRPGDFNQALMELGATVCKPRDALCATCPLARWCRAYQEQQTILQDDDSRLDRPNRAEETDDIEDMCDVCHPLESMGAGSSSSSQHVLIYPMAKERKKLGIREVAVAVVIWKEGESEADDCALTLKNILSSQGQTKSLLIKRPEKGLLAGLWEFPSIDLPETNDSTDASRRRLMDGLLRGTFADGQSSGGDSARRSGTVGAAAGEVRMRASSDGLPDISHVFSHLKVTYKPVALIVTAPSPPRLRNPAGLHGSARPGQASWVDCSLIMSSNIGNPHKKVWSCFAD